MARDVALWGGGGGPGGGPFGRSSRRSVSLKRADAGEAWASGLLCAERFGVGAGEGQVGDSREDLLFPNLGGFKDSYLRIRLPLFWSWVILRHFFFGAIFGGVPTKVPTKNGVLAEWDTSQTWSMDLKSLPDPTPSHCLKGPGFGSSWGGTIGRIRFGVSCFEAPLVLWCSRENVSLGPPVVPFYPFLGEGSSTKIDYLKKGTLILTSLLEDLEV